tara:strand:- start:235 stop:570 length:336 start_codon:yes stop_codon:yes gene_type:complete
MNKEEIISGFVFTHKDSTEELICMMHNYNDEIKYAIHIYDNFIPYGTWYGNVLEFKKNSLILDYDYLGKDFVHEIFYKDLNFMIKDGDRVLGMNDVFLTREPTTITVRAYV